MLEAPAAPSRRAVLRAGGGLLVAGMAGPAVLGLAGCTAAPSPAPTPSPDPDVLLREAAAAREDELAAQAAGVAALSGMPPAAAAQARLAVTAHQAHAAALREGLPRPTATPAGTPATTTTPTATPSPNTRPEAARAELARAQDAAAAQATASLARASGALARLLASVAGSDAALALRTRVAG